MNTGSILIAELNNLPQISANDFFPLVETASATTKRAFISTLGSYLSTSGSILSASYAVTSSYSAFSTTASVTTRADTASFVDKITSGSLNRVLMRGANNTIVDSSIVDSGRSASFGKAINFYYTNSFFGSATPGLGEKLMLVNLNDLPRPEYTIGNHYATTYVRVKHNFAIYLSGSYTDDGGATDASGRPFQRGNHGRTVLGTNKQLVGVGNFATSSHITSLLHLHNGDNLASGFHSGEVSTWDGSTLIKITSGSGNPNSGSILFSVSNRGEVLGRSYTSSLYNSASVGFLGTASWASSASVATFATTAASASFIPSVISASWASASISSSFATRALTSSYAVSASYSNVSTSSLSASYASNSTSASYAITASYVTNVQSNLPGYSYAVANPMGLAGDANSYYVFNYNFHTDNVNLTKISKTSNEVTFLLELPEPSYNINGRVFHKTGSFGDDGLHICAYNTQNFFDYDITDNTISLIGGGGINVGRYYDTPVKIDWTSGSSLPTIWSLYSGEPAGEEADWPNLTKLKRFYNGSPTWVSVATTIDLRNVVNNAQLTPFFNGGTEGDWLMADYNPIKKRYYLINNVSGYMHILLHNTGDIDTHFNPAYITYEKTIALSLPNLDSQTDANAEKYIVDYDRTTGQELGIFHTRRGWDNGVGTVAWITWPETV